MAGALPLRPVFELDEARAVVFARAGHHAGARVEHDRLDGRDVAYGFKEFLQHLLRPGDGGAGSKFDVAHEEPLVLVGDEVRLDDLRERPYPAAAERGQEKRDAAVPNKKAHDAEIAALRRREERVERRERL